MFILMPSIDGCMNGGTFYISHVHVHSLSSSAIRTSKLRQCKPFCILPLPLLPVHCLLAALFLLSAFNLIFHCWLSLKQKAKNSMNVKSYAWYVVHLSSAIAHDELLDESRFYMFSLNFCRILSTDECHKWNFFKQKSFECEKKTRQFILSISFRS